jgi:hypothetical protein
MYGITESSMGSDQAIIGSRTSRQSYATTTTRASGSGSRATGKGTKSSSWETVLCHSSQDSSQGSSQRSSQRSK